MNSGQAHPAHGTANPGPPPQVMVAADGICRTFGSGHTAVHALRGVSFTVDRGQLVALRGRSGSGLVPMLSAAETSGSRCGSRVCGPASAGSGSRPCWR
jgi:putative ABC transport system ATP-binding protein